MVDCVASPSSSTNPELAATELDCPSSASNAKTAGVWDVLVALPMILMTFLFRLAAVICLAFLGAIFLGVIFLAEISFGLGMILGPILIPWLIWERTQFLFDGWLKFTINATLLKIVAAVVVMVVALLVTTLDSLSATMQVTGVDKFAVDEFAAFLILIVSLVGCYVCWQVPALTQSLISGGTGLSATSMSRSRREIPFIGASK